MQKAYVSGNKMVKKDGSVILDSNKDAWSAKKRAVNLTRFQM